MNLPNISKDDWRYTVVKYPVGDDLFVTDTGEWEMIVTDSDSFTTRKAGPLIRTNSEPQQKFCNIIRKTLNRKGLFLLDGNWEDEAYG